MLKLSFCVTDTLSGIKNSITEDKVDPLIIDPYFQEQANY